MTAHIISLACSSQHGFSKQKQDSLTLLAGKGVTGDAHCGARVKHRSRVAVDPWLPNLRQVHLLHGELLDMLAGHGFAVKPGELGENITTSGIDLLGLSRGTLLRLGQQAVIEITGLRNPCAQIDNFAPGLLRKMLKRGASGELIRLAGVMGIVRTGGIVATGDPIIIEPPQPPFDALTPV